QRPPWPDPGAIRDRRGSRGGRSRFGPRDRLEPQQAWRWCSGSHQTEMVMFSVIPLLAVLAPAIGALLIAWTGERRANLREFWSVAAGVAMFALIASMIPAVLSGGSPECVLFRIIPGIDVA